MKNVKILIVDDEPSITKSVQYSLEKEGYTVIVADNGVDAIELARKERPNLAILDVMLPQLDGY